MHGGVLGGDQRSDSFFARLAGLTFLFLSLIADEFIDGCPLLASRLIDYSAPYSVCNFFSASDLRPKEGQKERARTRAGHAHHHTPPLAAQQGSSRHRACILRNNFKRISVR